MSAMPVQTSLLPDEPNLIDGINRAINEPENSQEDNWNREPASSLPRRTSARSSTPERELESEKPGYEMGKVPLRDMPPDVRTDHPDFGNQLDDYFNNKALPGTNDAAAKWRRSEEHKLAREHVVQVMTNNDKLSQPYHRTELAKSLVNDKKWERTRLEPADEQKFQQEFRASPFFKEFVERYKEEPNLDGDYDYRAFWQDGMRVERSPHDGTLHGPSKTQDGRWLKAPDHPTAWKEEYLQRYGVDPDAVGAKDLNTPPQSKAKSLWNSVTALAPAEKITGLALKIGGKATALVEHVVRQISIKTGNDPADVEKELLKVAEKDGAVAAHAFDLLSDQVKERFSDETIERLKDKAFEHGEIPGVQKHYPARLGIDIIGRGITSAPIAALQLFDEFVGGRGETPAQLDRNAPIRRQLISKFFKEHPEESGKVRASQPYNETDRRMLSEDLNSVKIKFDNWRKRQTGQELSPQERVTESFVDVRNPNSRF